MSETTAAVIPRRQIPKILGISQATTDRLMASGALPSVRISPRKRVVTADALAAFLASGKQ
jgi:predicted DNA-binding transcriptional regulator AlpA